MTDWLLLLLVILALGPTAWANSRHVVLAGYYRVRVAMRGAGETLDRRWLTVASVAFLAGVIAAGVVPRLVKVDWPVIPIPNITVESGPRQILIVRESEQDTNTTLDSTLVQLRNGQPASYLKSKSHMLLILDPDATGADGSPPAALAAWREKFPSRQTPVLIISDKGGKVLYAEPLSEQATAEQVLAIVRANE